MLAYVCDMDPVLQKGPVKECNEVENAQEDLCRKNRDWCKCVAVSENGEYQTLCSINVLVDCGKAAVRALGVWMADWNWLSLLSRSSCYCVVVTAAVVIVVSRSP